MGLKVGKWTENIGALASWALGVLLVAVAWMVWMRRGSATPIQVLPKWSWGTINFWAAIAYATSGMEGPGMMGGEIRDPERTMRRAGWIGSGFVIAFYVSTTVVFLIVLSPENISELNGFAEMGDSAGLLLGGTWLSPLIALLVVVSGIGFVGGLGTATSRLPFAAGVDRLLPAAFGRVHPRWGTPYVSILALGIVATLLLVIYQLGDTMRVAYLEMVSLMVIAGVLPYPDIFGCTLNAVKRLSVVSGVGITALALFCSVVPPAEITSVWLFERKLAAA